MYQVKRLPNDVFGRPCRINVGISEKKSGKFGA